MSRYRTLFSWSRITSKIKELIVTPLQEGCRGEKEGGGIMSDKCSDYV